MIERKGFRIRFPNLFPEGISVLGPMIREIDRDKQQEKESRARIEQRIEEMKSKNQSPQEPQR